VAEVGVVHLVRRKNGTAPFEQFLTSYRNYPAGVPHDLVLIFKGFPFRRGTQPYDHLLADVPHRRMYVADHGFDLRRTSRRLRCWTTDICAFSTPSAALSGRALKANPEAASTVEGARRTGADGKTACAG